MKVLESLSAAVKSWGVMIIMLGAVAASGAITQGGGAVLFVFVLMFAAIMCAFRSRDPHIDFKFGVPVLIAVCACVVAWGLLFNSKQPSDFGVYYRCGIAAGSEMHEWLQKCQSAYLDENSTYWLRSYFYSALIGRISGDNYLAFKFCNVLLHCLTLVVWFFGVRKIYGAAVASVAVVFLAFFPEYWFSVTLVTTDNAAVLTVVLFVLLVPHIGKRGLIPVASALALGVVVFLGNQLRSIGGVFMVALMLWGLCGVIESRRLAMAGYPLLAIFFSLLLGHLFNFLSPTGLPDLVSPLRVLSSIDFHTGQDFGVNYRWAEHFWVATPDSSRLINAAYKLSSEFNSGFVEWPLYLFRKSEIIYTGAGYYGLSAFPYPPGNPDSLISGVVNDIPYSSNFHPWLSCGIFALLALSLVGVFKVRISGLSLSCVVFIAAFGLVVVGAGESQARYSVLVAPALSLLAALSIFSVRDIAVVNTNVKSVMIGGVVLASVYLAVALISTRLPTSAGINRNVVLSASTGEGPGVCSNEGIALGSDYKKVRIEFADGSSCARILIPIKHDSSMLGLYLSGSKFPFKFEDRIDSQLSYQLFSGAKRVAAGQLGKSTVQWIEAPIANGGSGVAILLVDRGKGLAADHVDLTLIRESH